MEHVSDIFIVGIIFAAIYGVVRLLVQRRERLIMIEKGTNLPDMKCDKNSFSALKFGIFFIGIAIGVLLGDILTVTTSLDKEVAYFSMVFLFGGISLIVAHLIERKIDQK